MRWTIAVLLPVLLPVLTACSNDAPTGVSSDAAADALASGTPVPVVDQLALSEEDWKERLTPAQYRILRESGTERAYTGTLWDEHRVGIYACAGCGLPLFSSASKFDSGTGWPSYWEPLQAQHVTEHEDRGLFSVRTEIRCARCSGHLGHLFDDGPLPTGLRYCMNSAALRFKSAANEAEPPLD